MPQSQFIPARSSRHRVAVIALFRALVREGSRIPLPHDVLRNGKSPVPGLVKKGFERNKTDVSPRLVFAAMSAGYKFITLFQNAQDSSSKEHGEILTYLRDQKEMIARAEKGQPKRKKHERRPDYKPVLQRISGPDEPPEYITPRFPRPRDSFKGNRKVPIPVVTAHQHTFLRWKYPQPQWVSDYLRSKTERRAKLMDHMLDIERGGHQLAAEEDGWEREVAKALGTARGEEPEKDEGPSETYQATAHLQWRYASERLDKEAEKEVAKSRAMVKAAAEEAALLEKEKGQADEAGFRITLTKEETIQTYSRKLRQRKVRRRRGWTKRKRQKWQRRFVGLQPTPIQARM